MQKNDINYQGLFEKEAERILKSNGFNELPSQRKQSGLLMFLKILSEPMLLLLIGCGAIYLFLGESRDALMLLSFVLAVIGITFYQERKTERTLEALRDLSSPRALVIRNGEQKRIAGREVVKGDIIIVREGDRVPADAAVLTCENFYLDEALLTGESLPVRKSAWDGVMKNRRPGGDDLPFVYSGTLVTSGRGLAKVFFCGAKTEMGKIGKSLESIQDEATPLHRETSLIVRSVAIIGLLLCALMVFAYAVIKHNIIGGILAGLTLSMAMLPEEFPVVLLIFLTLGAWRISKRKVLTRRAAAIETLGAATVLCTDKTGTLTLNKMELAGLYAQDSYFEITRIRPRQTKSDGKKNIGSAELPERFKALLNCAVLASQKDPFDPLEKELNKTASRYLKEGGGISEGLELIKEYPLSKELLALSQVWRSADNKKLVIASKGAPEAIMELCHLNKKEKADILNQVKEMSDQGLRVLGSAKAEFSGQRLPASQHDFTFVFAGLLGFIDPERPTAAEAIREAYAAGMRVIMITGDYPGTAKFIAKKIGLINCDNYLTGEDLAALDQSALRKKIETINIFARVMPEQKLLIVEALKANGEIVAMTGDGVNDAPALKAAHIGIAMGERGTDVAREASSLVLLNDDFSSIVAAIRLGRRIYDNLSRAMGYILAVHVPIAGMSLLPLLFNLPTVLLPAHIAFLELIIDPACSLVFESKKEDRQIMRRPPRDLRQPLFNFNTVLISIIQGLGVLMVTFVLYVLILKAGKGEFEARSFAFVTLVLANLTLIIINLSWSKDAYRNILSAGKSLYLVFIGAVGCLLVVLYLPFFTELFHLAPLHLNDFLFIGLAVFISLSWFEVLKLFKGGFGYK